MLVKDWLHLVEPGLLRLASRDSLQQIRTNIGNLRADALQNLGFECRLGRSAMVADCALTLSPHGYLQLLDEGLSRVSKPLGAGSEQFQIWPAELLALLREWVGSREPSRRRLDSSWLEFDSTSLDGRPIREEPLMFLSLLAREAQKSTDPLDRGGTLPHDDVNSQFELALASVNSQIPTSKNWAAVLSCVNHSRQWSRYSQVGLMPSRLSAGLRLCLIGVAKDEVLNLLRSVRWEGPSDRLTWALAQFGPLVDTIGVHLDFVDGVLQSKLGIDLLFDAESVFDVQPPQERRWSYLLSSLQHFGLCKEIEANAILEWPGYRIVPADWTAGGSAAQSTSVALLRGLHHIKLVVETDRTVAKVYLGSVIKPFGQLQAKRARDGNSDHPIVHNSSSHPKLVSPLVDAVEKACSYLLSTQSQDGLWRDFLTPAGPSDEWVTAFVGCSLAEIADDALPPTVSASEIKLAGSKIAAERAWTALQLRQRDDGGWGYASAVPSDADSTVWGIRLGECLSKESNANLDRAYRFLDRCMGQTGGMRTYPSQQELADYIGARRTDFSGWLQEHVCVTANAANLKGLNSAVSDYLERTQFKEGRWSGYWWFGDAYVTSLAVTGLVRRRAYNAAVAEALRWSSIQVLKGERGRTRQIARHSIDCAFELAAHVRMLAIASGQGNRQLAPAIAHGLRQLIDTQQPDGSWKPSAALRIPPPGSLQLDPSASWRRWSPSSSPNSLTEDAIIKHTTGIFSLDNAAIYSTAGVLSALAAAQHLSRKDPSRPT